MKCQVAWKFTRDANWDAKIPVEGCGQTATHRAISTNGSALNIVQVCEECAMLAAPLKYKTDHFQGMKAGDPLWAIFPPIPDPTRYRWRPIGEMHEDYGPCVVIDIRDPGRLAIGHVCDVDRDWEEWATHFTRITPLSNEEADVMLAELKEANPA